MIKRRFLILCAFLVCLCLSVSAFAWSDTSLLLDDADLLTDSEEEALLAELEKISAEQDMDIVVVTADTLNGQTPKVFADDFYDQNGYTEDGILLLVNMEDSDWYISTSGYGITAITDAGLEYMKDQFVSDLTDGNYYDAFITYAELCDDFITQARSGNAYDVNNLPKGSFNVVGALLISFGIALVVAFIITGAMRSKLKTVLPQNTAKEYIKGGSMNITHSRDMFLYRHVDRRARPKESNHGGSHTHTSSSGRTHGGGGGKF